MKIINSNDYYTLAEVEFISLDESVIFSSTEKNPLVSFEDQTLSIIGFSDIMNSGNKKSIFTGWEIQDLPQVSGNEGFLMSPCFEPIQEGQDSTEINIISNVFKFTVNIKQNILPGDQIILTAAVNGNQGGLEPNRKTKVIVSG